MTMDVLPKNKKAMMANSTVELTKLAIDDNEKSVYSAKLTVHSFASAANY